jgi:hypothetical protein
MGAGVCCSVENIALTRNTVNIAQKSPCVLLVIRFRFMLTCCALLRATSWQVIDIILARSRTIGHKNIQHTVRYTELSPERFKDFRRD